MLIGSHALLMWQQLAQQHGIRFGIRNLVANGRWCLMTLAGARRAANVLLRHRGGAIVQKLIYGSPHVQLYVLRQLGDVLPPSAWKELLDVWDNLSAAVQVRVLRLSAEHADKFPDEWLLSMLSEVRYSNDPTPRATPRPTPQRATPHVHMLRRTLLHNRTPPLLPRLAATRCV